MMEDTSATSELRACKCNKHCFVWLLWLLNSG
jgi:hypothetical protein